MLETKRMLSYFERARERAKRRKSPWNIVLFAIGYGLWPFVTGALVLAVIYLPFDRHGSFTEIARLNENNLEMAVIVIPMLLLAKVLSSIASNLLMYCIPAARRVFEQEATLYPGTNLKASLAGLLKAAGIVGVVAIPLALWASWNLKP